VISINQLNYKAPEKSHATDGLDGYSMDLRTNSNYFHILH